MICEICEQKIKEKDNYRVIKDFMEGVLKSERAFHFICFKNSEQNKVKSDRTLARSLLERCSRMVSHLPGGEEVCKIKV